MLPSPPRLSGATPAGTLLPAAALFGGGTDAAMLAASEGTRHAAALPALLLSPYHGGITPPTAAAMGDVGWGEMDATIGPVTVCGAGRSMEVDRTDSSGHAGPCTASPAAAAMPIGPHAPACAPVTIPVVTPALPATSTAPVVLAPGEGPCVGLMLPARLRLSAAVAAATSAAAVADDADVRVTGWWVDTVGETLMDETIVSLGGVP
jgi:hypothetical protein